MKNESSGLGDCDPLNITCAEAEDLCMADHDELVNKILKMDEAGRKLKAEVEQLKEKLRQRRPAADRGFCYRCGEYRCCCDE